MHPLFDLIGSFFKADHFRYPEAAVLTRCCGAWARRTGFLN